MNPDSTGPSVPTEVAATHAARRNSAVRSGWASTSRYGSVMERSLPAGLVLRAASSADLPAVGRLLTERGDPDDAGDLERIVASEGVDGVAVIVDGDRVVSTAMLLDETITVDGQPVPAGQVDLVATDPGYEGRGLVRALMSWAHQRSRLRGHLVQVMVGIPYFYRQFGYEYVTPMAPWSPLETVPPAADDVVVRRATLDDIPAMQALQGQAQALADVAMAHRPATWRWIVERDGSEQWVAERDDAVVGVTRTLPSVDGAAVAELASAEDVAALALIAHAASCADEQLVVQERLSTPVVVRALLGTPAEKPDWYLGRVERLGPLLTHLAPVLQGRLAAAGLADRDHEVLLSSWRTHVRFAIGPSGFHLLAEGGQEQAPISKGGSGVPPDALASLVLGPFVALGLEERLPDCHLGRQREVMAALFPPRTADLLTYYLAV